MDGDREYPSIGEIIGGIAKLVALMGGGFFLFSPEGRPLLFMLLATIAHAIPHLAFGGLHDGPERGDQVGGAK